MKLRAVAAMCAWVFLFGCEDDDKKHSSYNRGQPMPAMSHTDGYVKIHPDPKGCADDDDEQTGTITDGQGREGKIKIKWQLTAAGIVTGALALTLLAGRWEWSS